MKAGEEKLTTIARVHTGHGNPRSLRKSKVKGQALEVWGKLFFPSWLWKTFGESIVSLPTMSSVNIYASMLKIFYSILQMLSPFLYWNIITKWSDCENSASKCCNGPWKSDGDMFDMTSGILAYILCATCICIAMGFGLYSPWFITFIL